MKNLPILICLFLSLPLYSQYLEAGLTVGTSNYIGELTSNSSTIYIQETKFAGGVFLKYNLNEFVAVKLGGMYGSISGDDANSSTEAIRNRNLNFKSKVYDFGLTGEFNILGYQPYNLYRPFSPYVFVGIGMVGFSPQTEFQGQDIDLQSLGTEGQGIEGRPAPYKTLDLAIPFGIGVKYAINDTWTLGLELGFRKTFTDYIDDVSQTYVAFPELSEANGELAALLSNRTGELLGTEPVFVPTGTPRGDNNSSDWLVFLGFSISYNFIDNGLVGTRGRTRSKSGCNTD